MGGGGFWIWQDWIVGGDWHSSIMQIIAASSALKEEEVVSDIFTAK